MRRLGAWAAIGLAVLLAACATTPAPRPLPPPPPAPPPLAVADLPGWAAEDYLAALAAVRAACASRRDPALGPVCARLRDAPPADEIAARRLLEASFTVEPLQGEGLLTSYFAPQYEGRLAPEPPDFVAPVRPPPPGLTGAEPPEPLPTRTEIEDRPPDGALAFMRREDLFFLQLQGSGVLLLPDGARLKAAFAGSNGRPFVGIARVMRDQGLIDDAHSSADNIRAWLAAHRGPEADAIMRQNPRYAFFTVRPDDGAEPVGAAGIPLPAGRALAIDPSRHKLGELYWIEASAPVLAGAVRSYRRLAAALDTGAAIKGEVRADLYAGSGDAAGLEAGRVRHVLKMYRLRPR
jgi:membrane-bound lytic murein transglycosylase A